MRLENFQMLDEVETIDVERLSIVAIARVPYESPVFDGHFPGWTAGYVLHIEIDGSDAPTTNQNTPNGPGLFAGTANYVQAMQSYWFIKSDHYGKVGVGLQSMASDNAAILVDGSGSLVPANWVAFDVLSFGIRTKGGGFVDAATRAGQATLNPVSASGCPPTRFSTVVVRTGRGSGAALSVSSLQADRASVPSSAIAGRGTPRRGATCCDARLHLLIGQSSLNCLIGARPQNDPNNDPRTMTAARAIIAPRMQTTTMSRAARRAARTIATVGQTNGSMWRAAMGKRWSTATSIR